MPLETKSSSPREVFLHLLAMVTLYMSAFSFGRLIFDYVNRTFPDLLEGRFYGYGYGGVSNESMRWSLAMLIIGFPIYFFTTRFLQKLYTSDPHQQTRRIRKWLLYLTLFLAAVVIIGDLVTLVYTFLGGELTVRFILKVITVLFIAGAIFGYYFWELRHFRESGDTQTLPAKKTFPIKYFVAAIILLVAANVVTGFFMVGSPKAERLARFDNQRVNDLQIIQNEIISFWQQKNRLPATILELQNDITGFRAPTDPETGTPYEYSSATPLQFELCAQFSSSNNQILGAKPIAPAVPYPVSYYNGMDNWIHETGRACFTRTIDPERFDRPAKF